LPPEDINSLPTPDFDGLPLDKYLSPVRVLPLQSSRGCYWGRCAFCTHSLGYGKRYQPRQPAKVAADIRQLKERYGVRYFAF
jgi:anaerobic magnesium-protoporphyrin IX monomethyl ester cyclase